MDDGLVDLAESGILEMGNAVSVTGDADGSHGPFLCLSFMREGEHLCLFAFRVRLLCPVPASPKTDAAPLSLPLDAESRAINSHWSGT